MAALESTESLFQGVVFDGPAFAGGIALAGRDPARLLEGGWGDWGLLESALEDGRRKGWEGGLGGWFDYGGAFRFGVFPRWSEAFSFPRAAVPETVFRPGMTRDAWVQRVLRAQEYIAAGDIYQVNLTHTLSAPWRGDPAAFYPVLRGVSRAPYACFLQLGDTAVLSASPECFLEIGGGRIVTRPIKGTRPRSADTCEDRAAAAELVSSAKERAELVMITDLERNDLGQICRYGSVRVERLCGLESFAHVHHLVSTVSGELRPGVSSVQAVRACFPGGSITGAPKKRAREIIAELEPRERGIYTGALGWFSFGGSAALSIAIRTLVIRGGVATYGVGAGIVADSEPVAEYEETLHKAEALFEALRGAKENRGDWI